jgi:hypothetical protein
MNQKLDMLLIGVLGDNSGSLDNDVQTLLKPTHIRCQSNKMLDVGIAQDAISDTLADERTNTVLRDFLKRGISPSSWADFVLGGNCALSSGTNPLSSAQALIALPDWKF